MFATPAELLDGAWDDLRGQEAPFQIRPARDDDRRPLAVLFAAVAEDLASLPTRSRPAQKSHQPTIIESRYEVKRGGRSAPARGSGVAFVDNIDAKNIGNSPPSLSTTRAKVSSVVEDAAGAFARGSEKETVPWASVRACHPTALCDLMGRRSLAPESPNPRRSS